MIIPVTGIDYLSQDRSSLTGNIPATGTNYT